MNRLRLVLNMIKTAKYKQIYIQKNGANIAVRDTAPNTSRYMLTMMRALFISFPFLFTLSFIPLIDILQLDRTSIILLLFGASYVLSILLIWFLFTALFLPKDHQNLLA